MCVNLPTKNGCVNSFKGSKYIPFLIKNYLLLKKYSVILNEISNTMGERFDSKLVCHGKYLKSEIESCDGKTDSDFQEK